MAVEERASEKPDERYYVTVGGQVRGPFDLELIEAMVLSGNFPRGVPLCKVGSQEWSPLPPNLGTAAATRTAGQPAQPKSPGGSKRGNLVFGGVIVILFAVGVFLSTRLGMQPSAAQQSAPTYSSSPAPLQNTPPAATDYRDPAGRTYRVPDRVHRELLTKKSSIDAQQASLNSLKSQVEALRNQIESKRPYVDQTNQYAVDEFNRDVARYNSLNQQLKDGADAFDASVKDYNTELTRFGTPIN